MILFLIEHKQLLLRPLIDNPKVLDDASSRVQVVVFDEIDGYEAQVPEYPYKY